METHANHLHKAPSQGWKHYFYEFLMLFLAVFCGFLVENYREERVEMHRAAELAKSFYAELKNDSAVAVVKVNHRIKQENGLKYLIPYFADSNLADVSKTFALSFEYGINFRSLGLFEPKVAMLEQLKNSGSMRYFKSDELQQLIGDLGVAIKNINDRQALETNVRIAWLNPILARNHDYKFWETVTKDATIPFDKAMADYEVSNTVIPFHLRGIEKLDREEITGYLAFYLYNVITSTRQVHIQKYIDVNEKLLSVLRREYHLE